MMSINEYFGQKILEQRQLLGLSQEKLALKASIDRTYVSDLEKGKRNISLDVAFRISEVLNVHISELLKNFNG